MGSESASENVPQPGKVPKRIWLVLGLAIVVVVGTASVVTAARGKTWWLPSAQALTCGLAFASLGLLVWRWNAPGRLPRWVFGALAGLAGLLWFLVTCLYTE